MVNVPFCPTSREPNGSVLAVRWLLDVVDRQRDDQHGFFLERVEDGLAQLGHVCAHLVGVPLKREGGVSVEQINAVAHHLAILGEVTTVEPAPEGGPAEGV